jgi:membrane protein YqaA with SNARE-associated domain
MMHALHRLKEWTMNLSRRPNAERALAGISFAESSFFPIPPDVLLIPITLGRREHWIRLATITTVASVIGGVFGYSIGYFVFSSVGQWIVTAYHAEEVFSAMGAKYEAYAFLTVLTAAFTPIPYKVITISAGFFHISFLPFMAASIVGRAARFYLVAWIVQRFGASAEQFLEKNFNLLTLIFFALLIGGFYVIVKVW